MLQLGLLCQLFRFCNNKIKIQCMQVNKTWLNELSRCECYNEYGMCTLINDISNSGNINLLDYFYQNKNIPFVYSQNAMDTASCNGYTHILNWWLSKYVQDKLEMKYSSLSIDVACMRGDMNILNWWTNLNDKYKFPFRYTELSFDSINNHEVLDWWKCINKKQQIDINLSFVMNAILNKNRIHIQFWLDINSSRYNIYGGAFLYQRYKSDIHEWMEVNFPSLHNIWMSQKISYLGCTGPTGPQGRNY